MAETSKEMINDMKNTSRQAVQTGKDIYQDAKSQLSSPQLHEAYDTLRRRAESAVHTSEDFVKDHPVATLLGAAAVGFVAGLIARRSRH